MGVSVCPTWNIGGVRGKIIQELAKKSRKKAKGKGWGSSGSGRPRWKVRFAHFWGVLGEKREVKIQFYSFLSFPGEEGAVKSERSHFWAFLWGVKIQICPFLNIFCELCNPDVPVSEHYGGKNSRIYSFWNNFGEKQGFEIQSYSFLSFSRNTNCSKIWIYSFLGAPKSTFTHFFGYLGAFGGKKKKEPKIQMYQFLSISGPKKRFQNPDLTHF